MFGSIWVSTDPNTPEYETGQKEKTTMKDRRWTMDDRSVRERARGQEGERARRGAARGEGEWVNGMETEIE